MFLNDILIYYIFKNIKAYINSKILFKNSKNVFNMHKKYESCTKNYFL
jgi:hypothetical protein